MSEWEGWDECLRVASAGTTKMIESIIEASMLMFVKCAMKESVK